MPDNTEDERAARVREIKAAYMRSWEAKNKEARKAYARERYLKNREAVLEKNRARVEAWHKENPKALLEHKRRYREQNREKLRAAHRKYIRDENGEMTAQYKQHKQRWIEKRIVDRETLAGRPRPDICDICAGPPDPRMGMHFDHCHASGHFRGWLCRKCNLMLGNAEDDPSRLRKGADYLERFTVEIHSKTLTD